MAETLSADPNIYQAMLWERNEPTAQILRAWKARDV